MNSLPTDQQTKCSSMMRFLTVFLLFAAFSLRAQDFIAEGDLGECDATGFYKFEIGPALSSWLTPGFANLRIIDESGQQVPYVVENGSAYETKTFVEYRLFDRSVVTGCCTSLGIENPHNRPIHNIHIRLANADVHKTASLSGSNDRQIWYALKDAFYLDPVNNRHDVSELRALDFPLSNYKYYRLVINDSTTSPLNIMSVGYYKVIHKTASYVPVKPVQVKVLDSLKVKKTFITVSFDTSQWIDRLSISADGAPYFLRSAVVSVVENKRDKKGRQFQRKTPLKDFNISNDAPSVLDLYGMKARTLLIEVDNLDSPPLKAFTVEARQLQRYGMAWLEKGKRYRIAVGRTALEAPQYDLPAFKDKLPVNMPSMEHKPIIRVKDRPDIRIAEEGFWQTRYMVWVAITGIIILLAFFSMRMIREAKASGEG